MDFSFLRKNMVDCQLKPNKIINLNLIDAFLKVPREIFVNKKNINQCYLDVNIDLTKNRFLLNPMVSARLIQSLNISKDDTVLTIGSGIGYNSVILSYLCNTVIGIESIKSFYDFSSDILIKLQVKNIYLTLMYQFLTASKKPKTLIFNLYAKKYNILILIFFHYHSNLFKL